MTVPGMMTVVLGSGSAISGVRGPRFGYNNAGVGAVVTADSTETGNFDPSYLFNWQPYNYWKPASAGVHYVTVIPATTPVVDYFALAQHTLGTNGATIKLQYSTNSGASWNDAFAAIAPANNNPIWKSFTAIEGASHWRIVVDSTPASVIGVVSFGQAYQPQYGKLEGFAPPLLARKTESYSSTSEAGLFLGRSILRRFTKTSITFVHMDPDDAYSYWLPFMKHAEIYPYFFAWNLEDFPADIAFMETEGDIPEPNYLAHGRVTTSINMIGMVPE